MERVERVTVDRCLARQLFKDFGGTGQSVTRLSDGDVQSEFIDSQFPHRV